ncbi:hypothetical protein [Rickettsiella endosymbiont of Aleochara curtula]|uniref:hypothetical protein n=1 Tax=Rickettsiella endosymbiont of Aleochara curtula TaxID=3077936 RepID=UPI00313ACD75
MLKKKNKNAKTSKTHSSVNQRQPPSIKQLVELQTYINTVKVLAAKVNRPAAIFFSLALFPSDSFFCSWERRLNAWSTSLIPTLPSFSEDKNYPDAIADPNNRNFNDQLIYAREDLIKFSLLVLMNRYVMTPLLFKVFPQGVYGTAPHPLLLREHQIPLTHNEVAKAISELKIVKQRLVSLSEETYSILLIFALASLMINLYFGDVINHMNLWLPSVIFSNFWDNMDNRRCQRKLKHKQVNIMEMGEQSLNNLSTSINLPKWNRVDSDDMEVCYFQLSIFRQDIKKGRELFQDMSISRLVKELVCVLYSYECIRIIAYSKHELALALFAEQPLSDIKIEKIKASFENRLRSIKNKRTLKLQLDKLFTSIEVAPEYEIQETNNDDFVTNYDFIIQLAKIPDFLKAELYTQLNDCFGDNCSIPANEKVAIITLATLIEQSRYESALKLLKERFSTYKQHLIQAKNPTITAEIAKPENLSNTIFFPRTDRENKKEMLTSSAVQATSERLSVSENYKWPSGTYSNTKDSEVVKIRGAHNLFSLFKLEREDFPRCQEDAYDRFKDIITNAHIVSKKNSQGIVRTHTPVKDRQGAWFTAKFKAKPLGACGNIRVYAREESDNQGHRLLIFEAIKLRSH